VPVEYGSLTVTSSPVSGAAITLDGAPTGEVTPHTFTNLIVGEHSVLLSYSGRMQYPSPFTVGVTTSGTDVNIVLYRDLTGRWRSESDGLISTWEMRVWEPDAQCPDGGLQVWGVQPVGRLCVEADDTLSLCKTHASECDGRWTEGQILEDGQRVEFTNYSPYCSPPRTDCTTFVYTRVD